MPNTKQHVYSKLNFVKRRSKNKIDERKMKEEMGSWHARNAKYW